MIRSYRRRWVPLFTAALATGVLTWPALAAERVTLEVWTMPGDSEEAVTKHLAAFRRAYPNIDVKVSTFEWKALHEKLIVGLATGVVPDMAQVEISFLGEIRDRAGNVLEDLSAPWYGGKYKPDILPHKWAQGSTREGRLIGFPLDLAPMVMYVRRSVFEGAGIASDPAQVNQMITNWEDFTRIARKVTRDSNGDGKKDRFMLGDARQIFEVGSRQTGLPMIDQDNRVHIDSQPWIDAMVRAIRFRDDGLDGVERIQWTWHDNWKAAISLGELATEFMGDWFASTLKDWAPDSSGDWAVANLPGNVGVSGGGSFYIIPSQSKYKREAGLLLQFLQDNAEPGISSNRRHWRFQEFDRPDPFFGGQRVKRAMAEAALNTPVLWVHGLNQRAVELVYYDAWRPFSKQMSPEAYLADKAKTLRAMVAEYVANLQKK